MQGDPERVALPPYASNTNPEGSAPHIRRAKPEGAPSRSLDDRCRSEVCRRVVERAPDLPDLGLVPAAAHAVGQEDEVTVALGVDPEGRAGEADVSERRG